MYYLLPTSDCQLLTPHANVCLVRQFAGNTHFRVGLSLGFTENLRLGLPFPFEDIKVGDDVLLPICCKFSNESPHKHSILAAKFCQMAFSFFRICNRLSIVAVMMLEKVADFGYHFS